MLAPRSPSRPGALAFVVFVGVAIAGCTRSGGGATTTVAPASAPSTQVMGSGTFHDVDGSASGQVMLVVKPDGGYAVVLESFAIDSIAHTSLVLVSNTDVTATADVDKSALLDLGPLKAAEGMQDFVIPADMSATVMDAYHTVVIWDTEMEHAIAAAPLQLQDPVRSVGAPMCRVRARRRRAG